MTVPILKMVHPDMSADVDRSFVYPSSGPVTDRGGHGLHGFAYGIGERGYVAELAPYAMTWLVLTADDGDVAPDGNGGKVAFDRAQVVGVYPDDLTGAVRHIARLTDDWTTPAAAAELAKYRYDDCRLWAVHRVISPSTVYLRTLGPAPALDAWNTLMQAVATAAPAPSPAAVPAIDPAEIARLAEQLALAERTQAQRRAARQRLREQHRAIAVDWFVPAEVQR